MVSSQLEYCKQIKHSCNHKCTYPPMWACQNMSVYEGKSINFVCVGKSIIFKIENKYIHVGKS
jgi:hypothetical protein